MADGRADNAGTIVVPKSAQLGIGFLQVVAEVDRLRALFFWEKNGPQIEPLVLDWLTPAKILLVESGPLLVRDVQLRAVGKFTWLRGANMMF